MRKKYIDEQWGGQVPEYNTELYRYHYFFKDIDNLLERFVETPE